MFWCWAFQGTPKLRWDLSDQWSCQHTIRGRGGGVPQVLRKGGGGAIAPPLKYPKAPSATRPRHTTKHKAGTTTPRDPLPHHIHGVLVVGGGQVREEGGQHQRDQHDAHLNEGPDARRRAVVAEHLRATACAPRGPPHGHRGTPTRADPETRAPRRGARAYPRPRAHKPRESHPQARTWAHRP